VFPHRRGALKQRVLPTALQIENLRYSFPKQTTDPSFSVAWMCPARSTANPQAAVGPKRFAHLGGGWIGREILRNGEQENCQRKKSFHEMGVSS